MWEAIQYDFMQHALLAIVLGSIACGLLGSIVVVNRMTFLAGGISHFAYGGVGLGVFLGWPLLPTTLAFTVGGALILAKWTQQNRENSDRIVSLLWAAGMAFGVLMMDLTPGYQVDLGSYLFGSILAIPASDLFWMAGIDCFILLLVLGGYKPLLAVSYDHEYAELTKVPVKWFYPLVLVLLACGVVILIRLVGIILVLALLTIPPSMLEKNASSLQQLMMGSTLLCFAMCLIGLIISYYGDTNTSAAIVGVAIAAYLTKALLEFATNRLSKKF